MAFSTIRGTGPDERGNKSASIPTTAFGEAATAELESVIQLLGTYGVTDRTDSYTSGTGTVSVVNNEFSLSTGATIGSYAVLRSKDALAYKPGVGSLGRLTARFTTPVASSTQRAGLFTVTNALCFGYNGTSFGVLHGYGGMVEIQTLTVSVGASGAESLTVRIDGTNQAVSVTSGTAAHNANEIAIALNAAFSTFEFYANGSTVISVGTLATPAAGTYTFTNNTGGGTCAASWAQTAAGAAVTTNWVAQASWNIDTCDWLDPTKGNVYQIEYQYLGYGAITFSIEDPTTGKIKPVHQIKYANANTSPSLTQPNFKIGWVAASLGSTTNLTVASPSAGAFTQGANTILTRTRAAANQKTGIGATATNILTLRNRAVYASKPNLSTLHIKGISAVTDSTKGAIIKVYISPTLAGTPNFSYVDSTNSIVEQDTAATTYSSGGRLLFAFGLGASGAQMMNFQDLHIPIYAGETITVVGNVTSGAASAIDACIVWQEDM
jgi:hypothetical protein